MSDIRKADHNDSMAITYSYDSESLIRCFDGCFHHLLLSTISISREFSRNSDLGVSFRTALGTSLSEKNEVSKSGECGMGSDGKKRMDVPDLIPLNVFFLVSQYRVHVVSQRMLLRKLPVASFLRHIRQFGYWPIFAQLYNPLHTSPSSLYSGF
jgi:hypothetical protein